MVKHISERDLLEMEEMDERLSVSMKFYNLIMAASYLGEAKHEMMIHPFARVHHPSRG